MNIKRLGLVGKYKLVVIFIALLAATTLAFAMGDKEPIVYTWRYKMTVAIETPEGEKSGSAVREVRVEFQPRPLPKEFPYHIETKVSGEAVPVDLGKRGMVFALIDWDSYRELYNAFPYSGQMDGKSKFPRDEYYKKTLKPGMKAELKTDIPRMVMFKDLKDPKSVVAVDRGNLAATFGTGVALKEVTIEMTDEPVTWGIENFLQWLPEIEIRKARLNGSTSIAISTNELSDNLGSGSFRIRR